MGLMKAVVLSCNATHLLHQLEGNTMVDLTERLDVRICSGILASKLVRRESKHCQPSVPVLLIQLFQPCELVCEAAKP